ncbi:MAG: YcfL family protein [Pseudomonadales bacterium]|nr:YcfL family protein [Pseudomonadales bacterium]
MSNQSVLKRRLSLMRFSSLMRLLVSVVLMGLGMSLFSGCASNTTGLQAKVNAQGDSSVTAIKLGRLLKVEQMQGEFINGLYRAKIVLANKKKSTKNLQYQFSWYDASGAEVDIDGNGWTPFVIYGKDEKTIVGLSPNPKASGFRINVRDLKANKTFKTNLFGIK